MFEIRKITGKTYLCGDLHNNIEGFLKKCKELDIRNSNIIILGDCEVGLRKEQPNKFYNYLSKQLLQRNNTIYLIRGNHDNPVHWEISTERYIDINTKKIIIDKLYLENRWPNIIHLPDSSLLEVNGDNYFIWGGAVSINRSVLKTDSTYFSNERTSVIEIFDFLSNIHSSYIKGVLAHTGPKPPHLDDNQLKRRCKIDKRLQDDINEELSNINKILDKIRPEIWYNGHYHTSFEGVYQIDDHLNYKNICLDVLEFSEL